MVTRFAIWAAGVLMAAWLAVPAHGAPVAPVEVRDLRMSALPDGAQIVLELSRASAHNLSVLENPDRVVLDIAGARLAGGVQAAADGSGLVKQVRFGRRPGGALRIVFDLSRPLRVRSPPSGNARGAGTRLVIDLRGLRSVGLLTARTDPPPAKAGAAVQAEAVPKAEAAPKAEAPVRVEHARPVARNLIIAIDAGHGGEDPGAIGKYGTQEKDVTLAIARALAERVNTEPGMRAVLTRDGDYFVPLRDRMRRARARQADLFVSIHADSIRDRSVDGSSVYILSPRGATDEAARWLAERENASDLIGGVTLDDKGDVLASVLLDLSQSASLTASQAAAEHVLHQLNRVGEIRKPQVQQAGFVVLKSPDIPSMLVETAYISNPQEELRLRGAMHQGKLASAIHQGLRTYFYDDPPAGTRIAELAAGDNEGPRAAAPPVVARPVLTTAKGDSGG
jgi:N-acetylmuramoyl-L-alanine amidase